MPTGHGDGPAICRLEDSSRRGQPFSFLRCSGLRARRPFFLRKLAPMRARSVISVTLKTRELRASEYASLSSPPRLEIRKPTIDALNVYETSFFMLHSGR